MGNKVELLWILLITCFFWGVNGAVNCTTAGRHADTADPTCQNYTLCVYDSSTSTFLAYNYTCPTTSVFNPSTAQCTASGNYVCNNTDSDTTTEATTDSAADTSTCTEDGFVSDPDSTDCSTYVICVETDGEFTETVESCPDSTYFNPSTTACESDYNCTTTDESECTAAGRFADSSDTTCQSYFLCVAVSDGSFVKYDYKCPTTSVFNPSTRVCTTSYTCPTE